LTLFDRDLAGQATAAVLLRSTTESTGETITLRASGSTGIFTANVATATGPVLTDGRLEVSHGDTIEAIYQDASPAGMRSFSARADLVPPVISGVVAASEFGRTTLRWSTDEVTSGLVLYGTNALNLSATSSFLDTDHELALGGVRFSSGVLDNILGVDAHEVFAGQRGKEMDGFDVVHVIRERGVGHRLSSLELVATIKRAVGRDDFEVEVVHQGGDGCGEARHVGVSQGDLKRPFGVVDQHAALGGLPGAQPLGLIDEFILPRRSD